MTYTNIEKQFRKTMEIVKKVIKSHTNILISDHFLNSVEESMIGIQEYLINNAKLYCLKNGYEYIDKDSYFDVKNLTRDRYLSESDSDNYEYYISNLKIKEDLLSF